MQGARCDAVRALLAAGNAAERRLWKSEITIIYWGLLRVRVRHGIVLRHRMHGPRLAPGRFLRLRRRHGFIDGRRVGRAVGMDD